MVTTLMRSTLREIRQSLGRYLAILAIVGLGVGFFAGLRMCEPDMKATGISYLDTYRLYDLRLISTLGFTEEDVAYFSELEGVDTAAGSIYTEFLWRTDADTELVLMAHALTPGVNEPELTAGRLPGSPGECLGDGRLFSPEQLGTTIRVAPSNDEDTRELFSRDEYTLVGLTNTPLYLNYERGTASIGSGRVSGFVLLPEEGFDSEAYHELYIKLADMPATYSQAYDDRVDALTAAWEERTQARGDLRYETLYADAMEEIRDGEAELADGWEEYRSKRAEAEQELADAYAELTDGEAEYTDGLADYEQGKLDYADGLQELNDARRELDDGWLEYEEGKTEAEQELSDALKELEDGEAEYAEGAAELEDAKKQLRQGQAELNAGADQLNSAQAQLNSAKAKLESGEAGYQAASSLYQTGQALAGAAGLSSTDELLALPPEDPRADAINDALIAQNSSLDEFKAGWQQAEQELGPLTEETLAGVRQQLDQGQKEYDQGLAEYQSGAAQMAQAGQQFSEAEQKLKKAEQELADARQKLDEGWLEYEAGKAEAEQELAEAEQELLEAEQELADGKAELAKAKRDLDKAPGELADARKELDDGWLEYYDGLAEAEQEFTDAERELSDGEQEIADAYAELADLDEAKTFLLTRRENQGYACFDNDTAIIEAISVVFPVFFFLVAALVCMTTMTRMVDEQRTQIGVLKAMGYSNSQIMGKYLFYSGGAATLGSIIGYILGSMGLPWILWQIYGIMYGFSPLRFTFDPLLAAICFAAALLCSMGATYAACRSELKKPAAELIRPKAPKAGQRVLLERITPLWKHLSFLYKVSVRNVLRYRSRLVMMVLGIGGCTALLVTGFGIRDSISTIADDQFDSITLYDYAVAFQDPLTREDAGRYLADRNWPEERSLLVHSASMDIIGPNASKTATLVISSTDSLEGFISLHTDSAAIPYPGEDQVVINRRLADSLGVEAGDSVELRDDEIGSITATVSAVCDNYVQNYIYLSQQTYEKQMGQIPDFHTLFLLSRDSADPNAEGVHLAEHDDVSMVTVNQTTRDQVNTTLERLDLIVVVVVVCAAALAFIVLYNLTNINITERIREIATIRVLGFYHSEVASYVFREILILSALGSLAGLLMGKALHAFVIAQVQVDGMFFPTRVLPVSYIFSLVLTLLFAALITWSMGPRLRKVDMAESLKSIE